MKITAILFTGISLLFFVFSAVAQQQAFVTSGTHSFTTHPSVIELTVEAIGGGGGGGRCTNGSVFNHKANGGGGGGAYIKTLVGVSGSTNYSVVVGAGGYNNSNGTQANGGDSYFGPGTQAFAQGGRTKFGDAGDDNVVGGTGGAAGSSIGTIRFSGGDGGCGEDSDPDGGGGGGAAGPNGNGNRGVRAPGTDGACGINGSGTGAGGLFLSGATAGGNGGGGGDNGGVGAAGASYGGAGGGSSAQSGSSRSGGAGAAGIVVLAWSRIDNVSTACAGSTATITGFNFSTTLGGTAITTTAVTLNGTAVAFTINSNTQLTITLPVGAVSGNVIVTTTLGRAQYTMTVNATSVAPTAVSGSGNYCFGNQVTLTATGGSLGAGASYRWYSGSCGGTAVATTTIPSYTFAAATTGSTTYFVRAEGTCNTTACASAVVILPTPNILATNGESTVCTVNAGETVHFFETTSGNYIATVIAGGNSLGSVRATAYVESGSIAVPACSTPHPMHATNVLARHWVITPTTNAAATVRLPYYLTELNNLMPLANGNANPDDNVGVQSDLQLSKYSGGSWPSSLNVDSDPNNNCAPPYSTGAGGTTIQGPVTSGTIAYFSGFGANLYSEYTVTGFSEFWLHGGISSTPLAVELTDLYVSCESTEIIISWTTASEQQSSHFIVEKSRDGLNWEIFQTISGAGTKHSSSMYQVTDPLPGTNYYRIQQVDFNGVRQLMGIKEVPCKMKEENRLIVYPNPAREAFTVEIHSTRAVTGALLLLTDVTGKQIDSRPVNIAKGVNQVYFNQHQLQKGTYMIHISGAGLEVPVSRIVID